MKHKQLPMLITAFVLVASAVAMSAQYKPIVFKEYDLPNGLHVILHEDHSAPVAATVVHYRVGSRDEDPARTGFAHFFEHLMFESTDAIERGQIDKLINGSGGQLNAFTSQDETVYHFVVPSNEIRLPLWIEAQRMRKLHVDQIGVETQRGVVKEERKNRYDNASYSGWLDKTFASLYDGTPYQWSTIGSAQHIDSAAIREFQQFYDMYYRPNNAVLVVSGDFDEKVIRETVNEYFGGYPKGAEPVRPTFTGLKPLTSDIRQSFDDPRAQLPAVFIGYRAMGQLDQDAYAADLLDVILTNGESSRMYRAAVDSEQVAVQVNSSTFFNEHAGIFLFIGIASPGKDIGAVEKAIDAQLARLVNGGITEAELQKAKNIREAAFIASRVGVYDKALALSNYYRFHGNTALINEELDRYMKVTTADINRVAKRLFDGRHRTVLTFNPVKG